MRRAHLLAAMALIFATVAARGEPAGLGWRAPAQELVNTRERPLFSPTRRPKPPPPVIAAPAPPPAPPPPPPQPTQPPRATLVGIVNGGADATIALLRDEENQSDARLHIGDTFKDWKLEGTRTREADFSHGAERITLRMPDPGPASPGGLPMPGMPNQPNMPAPMFPQPQIAPGRPGGAQQLPQTNVRRVVQPQPQPLNAPQSVQPGGNAGPSVLPIPPLPGNAPRAR